MATIEIKRYSNRKLYTHEHGYLTLAHVAGYVRDGHDVRVLQHKTGLDVTAQTLGQVIVDDVARGGRYDVVRLSALVRESRVPHADGSAEAIAGALATSNGNGRGARR